MLVATPRLFRCHQCLCFQSFTTHPPRFTTQSQSLSSSCPCAHSFCHSHSHTAKPHHHATHSHTRGGWCTLVPGVCVCVPTVLAVAAPGSPLTRPPTPCAPHHTTPPLAAAAAGGGGCGGGSVGVVACVATWSTHWLCWCCPLPIHTHTRGDGHVVVVAVCVVWLPPPLCAFPTNHHHCVRCPALSAECVCEWWHHAHPPTVVPPTLVCVCVSERRGHHTHHPRCRPMCPLSPLTRHATPATLSQMPRLTSLTHMACFVWLLPSTHTHTGWLTAHTPSTHHHHWVCVCSSTCSHPPLTHTHTGRTGVAHAWVVAGVVTTTTPLVPHHHTHTHSGTGGVGHGGAWWCACALCVPPTPPSHSPSLPPPPPTLLCHHRPHTHTRDLVHAPLPHTHTPHAPPHTPRRAVC